MLCVLLGGCIRLHFNCDSEVPAVGTGSTSIVYWETGALISCYRTGMGTTNDYIFGFLEHGTKWGQKWDMRLFALLRNVESTFP